MNDLKFDSTDRTATDYVLFAAGFIGFLTGVSGIVICSLSTASIGAALLILVVHRFSVRAKKTVRAYS